MPSIHLQLLQELGAASARGITTLHLFFEQCVVPWEHRALLAISEAFPRLQVGGCVGGCMHACMHATSASTLASYHEHP